jgi:hypothetical protein
MFEYSNVQPYVHTLNGPEWWTTIPLDLTTIETTNPTSHNVMKLHGIHGNPMQTRPIGDWIL